METGERDLLSLWKIISKYIMPIEEAYIQSKTVRIDFGNERVK